MEKRKRILWLFNHTSLRKTQVPMLIDLGYEVYCPKIYSHAWGDYSASVSYEYDQSLSLPTETIDALNQIDFYSPLSAKVFHLLNRYFDIVFCMGISDVIESFLHNFHGVIVLQGFGLEGDMSYTELIVDFYHLSNLYSIKMQSANFWLALSYDNCAEVEAPLLQARSIYLPIGLNNAIVQHKWVGGDSRVLFIAPKIKTSVFYNAIYKDFCANFGDFPHVIGGAQVQQVADDPTVTGFLSEKEYVYNMTHLAAMFYHSQEPRHLHYHPLEAVKWGMPLIFMAGGMLDHIGGKDLPGRAETVSEARKKLKRLMDGDKAFIKKVTESQEKLLEPFTDEYCRPFWEEGMKKIDETVHVSRDQKKKRIAVILPAPYTGGVYDYAIRFALAVQSQIQAHKAKAELVFAYPKDKVYDQKEYFSALRKQNIQIREFVVEERDSRWADAALQLAGYQPPLRKLSVPPKVVVLRDGIKDFCDCDYVFFMSDLPDDAAPLFFLCPYTMVVHDYIQRYVPEAIPVKVDTVKCWNQQQAHNVFVTSEPTRQDAIQHACLAPERVILTPPLLAFPIRKHQEQERDHMGFFLWSTNAAPHKNHFRALEALESYYQQGGRLDCIVTGANTHFFQPQSDLAAASVLKDYVAEIQERIRNSDVLREHLLFKGNMPKSAYEQCLAAACFVFHPGYGDNGNFTVTDAAALGVPALASDYPAMRYLANYAQVPVKYMDPFDVEKMTESLLAMETEYNDRAKALPKSEKLEKKSFMCNAEHLYQLVKEQIVFEEEK